MGTGCEKKSVKAKLWLSSIVRASCHHPEYHSMTSPGRNIATMGLNSGSVLGGGQSTHCLIPSSCAL